MADQEDRSFEPHAPELGEGTPANVDIHKLGQSDRPQEEWGEAPDAEAQYGSNHSRRGEGFETDRLQGSKTRTANKDIVSRRS